MSSAGHRRRARIATLTRSVAEVACVGENTPSGQERARRRSRRLLCGGRASVRATGEQTSGRDELQASHGRLGGRSLCREAVMSSFAVLL